MGTYGGKGKEGGKTVIYTDKIPILDILCAIEFAENNRLPPSTVKTLKNLY